MRFRKSWSPNIRQDSVLQTLSRCPAFSIGFAAFGSIEQNPKSQVVGKVLKTMFYSGRREQNVSWIECPSANAADIFPAAGNDEIYFIAGVWLLRIYPSRRVDFDKQAAVSEDSCKTFSIRTGQANKRVSNGCGN